jgi:hypothetical protein
MGLTLLVFCFGSLIWPFAALWTGQRGPKDTVVRDWVIGQVFILVLTTITAFVALDGVGQNYSQGAREGLVYKVSDQGVFWKSTEGEMNLGAVSSGAATTWGFSTRDENIAPEMRAAIGKTCRVEYRKWWARPVWLDTSYEVVKVACKP